MEFDSDGLNRAIFCHCPVLDRETRIGAILYCVSIEAWEDAIEHLKVIIEEEKKDY